MSVGEKHGSSNSFFKDYSSLPKEVNVAIEDLPRGDSKIEFVGFASAAPDARFPYTNQSKHCFQSYVDYYKCITAKGEDFAPCKQFQTAYNCLCPDDWIEKWNEQRENGIFPAKFEENSK